MIDCVCFSRLHADIITSFKLINIPEVAHKNPFKCDMGQANSDAILCSPDPFSSRPNVKEEKICLRETSVAKDAYLNNYTKQQITHRNIFLAVLVFRSYYSLKILLAKPSGCSSFSFT